MSDVTNVWPALLTGSMSAAEAATRLNITEAQAQLFVDFHQASRAQLALEQTQRTRRRVTRGALVALATGVLISGAAIAADGNCPNGYPFCFSQNQPAIASQVNHNFDQIKEWLEAKVGPTSSGNVTVAGTMTANGATVSVPTGRMDFGSSNRQMLSLFGTTAGFGTQTNTLYQRSPANFAWFNGGAHNSTAMAPGSGGSVAMRLEGDNLTVSGDLRSNELFAPAVGDTPVASLADVGPEVYQLTGSVPGHPCDAAHRGAIIVARPSAQNIQDSLCYCGQVDNTYAYYCFNP